MATQRITRNELHQSRGNHLITRSVEFDWGVTNKWRIILENTSIVDLKRAVALLTEPKRGCSVECRYSR